MNYQVALCCVLGSLFTTVPVATAQVNTCPHANGDWIATEHYLANLVGGMTDRVDLFTTPGGEKSSAYGLGQDPVITIAEACVDGVMWRQIKFPAERYGVETVAWLRATAVALRY